MDHHHGEEGEETKGAMMCNSNGNRMKHIRLIEKLIAHRGGTRDERLVVVVPLLLLILLLLTTTNNKNNNDNE